MDELKHAHPLTVGQLLKPRFKCLQTYPRSPFTVGETIELTHSHSEARSFHIPDNGSSVYYFTDFIEHPHLFRKMQWWEERELKDMPLYCRNTRNGVVLKAQSWEILDSSNPYKCISYLISRNLRSQFVAHFKNHNDLNAIYVMPATHDEYLQHLKEIEKQL